MSDVFTEQYSRLNKAQKDAVDSIEGPVMVIAGPGTGKTTILTLRIANILKSTDTPAHGILAITYTDAGVKAMRTKLQHVIGDRAHEVGIFTFHGLANAIIAEYPDHFLHISDMKLMTDIEQETLIRSIISESTYSDLRPAGRPDAYVSGIIRAIDDAKREALTPVAVKEHATKEIERIKHDESSISTRGATKGQLKAEAKEAIEKCERTLIFADVYKAYEDRKHEAKQIDFNDLIIELLLALRNDELLLRLIQERYLYIHVDEHQDTNDAQNFIIGLIAEFFETPNIFIVGDEKQAIYRFQGASVENFLKLRKKWPAMKLISLDTNYRSHQSILDASFSMIEKNYEEGEQKDLRIKLKGASKGGADSKQVSVITGEHVPSIENYLVNELRKLTKEESNATVAIIVRRNRDLDRVIRLLESHGIPVSSERSVDIFSHPIGRLFFDLISYLADPSRIDALAKTIVAGMWKGPQGVDISYEQRAELVRGLKSNTVDLEKNIPELLHLQRTMLNDSPIGFIIHIAEVSGFTALVSQDPSYIHVWRGIVTLAESLTKSGNLDNPSDLIAHMLAYRTSAESRPIKISVGAPDVPITAMTAHGSKGLEFDYVFIPYATDESWIGRNRGASFVLPQTHTSDSNIQDVRRLFYVALTRARKHVTVLTALEEVDGKGLSPLRFIEELDADQVQTEHVARIGVEHIHGNESLGNAHTHSAKLIDLAKSVLLKKGLSVTALNNFLECPSKFLYNSILKLPQAPSISAEKGTAMHEAISKVWESGISAPAETEKTMTNVITEYFKTSFLPKPEKESALKDLLEDIHAVAVALEPHFGMNKKTAHTELWVEGEFKGVYEKSDIRIPVHGKLDAVIDIGNEVLVFDYKTKQAMSVNAIKGETASSDGGYFRQLIFYKMLMSFDSRWKTRRITPALTFVSPDSKGRCPTITIPIEGTDIERVQKEIQSLIDSVWSGEIAIDRCTDISCEWCGMKKI
jgi:DNA helicase-2/ATP-dependent DNA helicase PcrA